jgi:single-strand DNA-binding protein
METFIGRLTSNAQINTLKDERHVVNFSIAINNTYRAKNDDEQKKATTYINCAYWLSTKVADHLTKGSIVEVSGRLYVRAYTVGNDAKASLNCHVNHIKIHHFQNEANASKQEAATATATAKEKDDDLPF